MDTQCDNSVSLGYDVTSCPFVGDFFPPSSVSVQFILLELHNP